LPRAAGLPLALLLLSACAADSTAPASWPSGTVPGFAKAPAPVSTEWTIDDLAGVASDGLGPYIDGSCGVIARVYTSGGGNGQLQPEGSRSRCGFARTVSVTVGSLLLHLDGMVGHGIWGIPSGTSTTTDFTINTGTGSCALLKYNAETGAPVQVTAGTTGSGKRTWLIESAGSHAAGCYVFQGGGHLWDGQERIVPLRITVTAR